MKVEFIGGGKSGLMSAKVIRLPPGRKRREGGEHWLRSVVKYWELRSIGRVEATRELALLIDTTVLAWLRRGWRLTARYLQRSSRRKESSARR